MRASTTHTSHTSRAVKVRLFVLSAFKGCSVKWPARGIGFLAASLAALFILMTPPVVLSDGISELGASQIGDNTVKAIDHDLNRYDRTTTLFSSPENGILPHPPGSETAQRIRHNLENHIYWGVHYLPKSRKKGDGALAVFIDSKTGAILGIYTEK